MSTFDPDQPVEAINDELYARGATDGLPVVPPTSERIEEMLRGTDRPAGETLGTLGDADERLTVERLAANAVAAGCTPLHFPLVIAGAIAMTDADSNAGLIADDPGSWALQWIVNGPVREPADVRSDTGAFGPGFRTNRSVSRALGFAFQNVTGYDPADETTGGIGNPFQYTLLAGEHEEASPWEPYHVSRGYAPEDSTITFAVRRSFLQFIPHDMTADAVAQAMAANTSPDMFATDAGPIEDRVVFTLGPYNAEELADGGFDKADVKAFLADNSVRPYEEMGPVLGEALDIDADWFDHAMPMQVPKIADPELVDIIVVGGSGRFNAIGRVHGDPITRVIELPETWETLQAEYGVERDWGKITKQYEEMER